MGGDHAKNEDSKIQESREHCSTPFVGHHLNLPLCSLGPPLTPERTTGPRVAERK